MKLNLTKVTLFPITVLLFSILGCKKDDSPINNNPPNSIPSQPLDTTSTFSKITLQLKQMYGGIPMYIGKKFKNNLNIIWGDGLFNNYLFPSTLLVSGSDTSVRILSHSNWGGNGNFGDYIVYFFSKGYYLL